MLAAAAGPHLAAAARCRGRPRASRLAWLPRRPAPPWLCTDRLLRPPRLLRRAVQVVKMPMGTYEFGANLVSNRGNLMLGRITSEGRLTGRVK